MMAKKYFVQRPGLTGQFIKDNRYNSFTFTIFCQ
uniref:Uncharacterized protein n=1 Tax=Rhizophora mucronata TaxID=61149 RepID=A0A2P2NT94_RHIMU